MVNKQQCPRRAEGPGIVAGASPDIWERRHGRAAFRSCSYCGSMHPGDFMELVRTGAAELGPTDKNYKVYVASVDQPHSKFYFQHLEDEQRTEFVDLYNSRSIRSYAEHPHTDPTVIQEGTSLIRIGYPGYFYVLPFFASAVRG